MATITGTAGNDTLNSTRGGDDIDGGAGIDTVSYADATGDVTVNLGTPAFQDTEGAGTDRLTGIENLFGSAFDDKFTGNSGANLLSGLGGDDLLDGGDGNDTLAGGEGDDHLYGGAGADSLDGGEGEDRMAGGPGKDVYYVDSPSDVIVEGPGEGGGMVRASVSYTLAAGVYVGTMATTNGASTAPINLTGNELNQSMYGNAGDNILDGGGGNDYFVGSGGGDTFIGGTGNDVFRVDSSNDVVVELAGEGGDTVRASVSYVLPEGAHVENLITTNGSSTAPINLTGNSFNNSIYGNAGANVLSGGAGDDYLVGLGGNDTLIGGSGKDAFSGGAGNDRFVFNAASESAVGAPDRVLDFAAGDLIDLSGIDANGGLADDQAFAFVGSNAFTGTAGELRSSQNANGTWRVEGDIDGDGIADFAITVTSAAALTAGDFVL